MISRQGLHRSTLESARSVGPANQDQLLERMNQLEHKMDVQPSPQIPATSNLEGQIEKLVQVLTVNNQSQSKAPTPQPPKTEEPKASAKESFEQVERLKTIEAQMKELLQISVNNEKIQAQTKKEKKKPVPILESHSSDSDEFVTIPTKIPKADLKSRSLVWLQEEPTREPLKERIGPQQFLSQ
jgi:hypothetical protein